MKRCAWQDRYVTREVVDTSIALEHALHDPRHPDKSHIDQELESSNSTKTYKQIMAYAYPDHITDALATLDWLRVPELIMCIMYKTALLTFHILHCEVPRYLSDRLVRVTDVDSRRRLRSSSTT